MRIQTVNKNVYTTSCSQKNKCKKNVNLQVLCGKEEVFLVPCPTTCENVWLGFKGIFSLETRNVLDISKEGDILYNDVLKISI